MIHQKFRVYLRHCITVFFISVAFSQAKNRQNIELPISSKQLSHYYAQSPSGVYEFYLEPKYQEKTTPFNAQESSVAIKGHHFSYNHVSPDIGYAELGGFQLNEHTYKLIAYNHSDDADIVIFNIQLNSYDSNGQLIDALLLDSRFGFEDIQKFSEFKIVQDIVTIDYYVTQVIDVVNGGELGAIIESPIPQLEMQEQYKIDQNGFKLISQTNIGAVL